MRRGLVNGLGLGLACAAVFALTMYAATLYIAG